MSLNKKAIGFYTATSLVIANMIGTGVFTSLGFQLLGIHSVFSLLLLWIIGGVIALCGALSYGELGAAMPRSGGEYQYLSKIFHPLVGFLSGWVSVTVGFAAPTALAAMAMGLYAAKVFPGLSPIWLASSLVILLTLIHTLDMRVGRSFQNIFTSIKLILIVLFIISGFVFGAPQNISVWPDANSFKDILSPAFAISLIYVSYAYSGWNAAAYIAGEIENPQKNLPKALFRGTLIVMVLYLLLNFIFLYTVPMNELAGQLEIGYISADKIFGITGGRVMGMIIALLLVSSVSSMIIAGPRVAQAMGEDIPMLNTLAAKNKKGIPAYAILLQSGITLVLILTSTFENVLTYVGFTLSIFSFLTVFGVFIYRKQNPNTPSPYRAWGYPFTPALFLILSLWIIVYTIYNRPMVSLAGGATLLVGVLIYFSSKNKLTV
jgi:APA family basic amino acid/polyamine antiporter